MKRGGWQMGGALSPFSHFINPCGILTHKFIGDSPIRPADII